MKETSSQREAKLKKVAEQVRLLHRERDNALKKLKISEEESKEFQGKLEKAEVEVDKFTKEIQETKA